MTRRASTSSSFHYHFTYDVFLNFRGEDTRHGFTGNLYNALTQKGIHTFIDGEELKKGDEITPTLLKAIEESRMAIIVFSKNYASSAFCLNELVKILHSIKGKGRLVWPIFYDVEPSEVRHQKGNYEQALALYKNNFKVDEEKINNWKFALHKAANISGLHFNPRNGQYEYQFIERIVTEISNKINRVPLYVAEYPVGLDSQVLDINSLLQLGSNEEVKMVGICGLGGIGKTTIARAMYNLIADNFEGLCFLHDIKENSMKLGLERTQERMLSKILGMDIKLDDVNEGVSIIKKRLKQKKILLILDNVDKREQLEKLAGHCDWFGSGSRIIITTRDKHLLGRHGVERKYEMKALNYEDSLELLSWNAFRSNQVDSTYKFVLNHVICYAQGLPLALEVIGSHLFGRSINEWESALDVYKRIPNKDIQRILKISYDGLDIVERELFLDIACFFKGAKLDYVIDMLEHAHGFDPHIGIQVLVDKCLITFEVDYLYGYDVIEMHDLIQDMGREIVHQESPSEPGKRSRLWSHQDIAHVLEESTGTNEVRMIIFDNLSGCIEVNWDGEAFKSMRNLKILIFENLKFSEGPKYLPNSLKVLVWRGYPSSCLPYGFCPKKLVVFELANSCLNSVETIKKMENLSVLNLGDCEYITQIPNLSCLSNLRELSLESCKNLIEIDDSVGELTKLEILNVSKCSQLKTFPRGIKLPSLVHLWLDYCSSLKYFPEILEKMEMTYLRLAGTGIEKLPSSICNLTELGSIDIREQAGERLIELPSSVFLLPKLFRIVVHGCGKLLMEVRSMPCPNMDSLALRECNISNENLQIYFANSFINMTSLDLSWNNFTILPACIKECHFLWELSIRECKHLREVEGIPPNIKELNASGCISLSSKSRNLLLSEELLGAVVINDSRHIIKWQGLTRFCLPGVSIPKWFDHCSKEASVSFWFRNSFPTLCVCAIFKPFDYCFFYTEVFINEERISTRIHMEGNPEGDDAHIVVYDIKMKQVLKEGEWNHAKVYTYSKYSPKAVQESGIYVIRQHSNMEDIRFTNPFESLDSMSGNQDYETIWSPYDEDDVGFYYTSSDGNNLAEEEGTTQLGTSVQESESDEQEQEQEPSTWSKEQEDEALISESFENVTKAKGKDIKILCEDDSNEKKGSNMIEVTRQSGIFDSNGKSLRWDPMECEYQVKGEEDTVEQTRDPWLRLLCFNVFTFVASLCSPS